MKQNQQKSILLAIPVIAAMALIPFLSVTVFAEDTDVAPNTISLRPDSIKDITSVEKHDKKAEVMFDGTTKGWAIITGQAYTSTIKLDGNAVHQGKGVWKVTSDTEIEAAGKTATLELKGKAHGHKLRLHGTGTLDSGESFRIILRGHFAPVYDQPGDFVLDFTAARIYNTGDGVRIPLIQDGIIHVKAVDPTTPDFEDFVDDVTLDE